MGNQYSEKEKKQCMGCMEFFDGEYDLCPYCGYEEGQGARELLHMKPGTELRNRYIVGRSIGYGGFGITYIGWDIVLKRKIAIKEYMPSEFSTRMMHHNELTVANNEKKQKQFHDGMYKFIREAEKLAQVGNIDGIVHVFDSFEENNTAYIVMEYLEGETLAAYLKREGIVDEQQTLDLMLPLLQALETVHEKGIIHRDIAPDNIFLVKDKSGNTSAKLIDFGASKFATTSHSKSLTVIIKPGFSPEEQYRSDGDQGTYTDVYAMAAVMYKMVTGQTPPDAFERRTQIESKKKDLLDDPSKYTKELSENFETALLNAMNVRIEDRSATIPEFVDELISFELVKRRGVSIRKIDFMKWPLWAKIVVPTASIASIALVILLSVGIIKYVAEDIIYELPEGMTLVPDIVNEELDEVQEWVEEAGLVLSSTGSEYYPNVPENLVLSQDIAAGSIVNKNSIVSVRVSTVEEIYSLPDVVGYTEEYARLALECMGIEVICTEATLEGLAPGTIISQDVEPYTEVKTGQTINLVVNTRNGTGGVVPQLVGLEYEDALETAAGAGVNIVIKEKIFSKERENIITAQNLSVGAIVESGNVVEVTLALGWREFMMPNLMYKPQTDAEQLLKNIGITPIITKDVSELVAAGLVMEQDVESEEKVQPEQEVKLQISSGSKPFAMPSVIGMDENEAQKILIENGLAVNIQYGYDTNVEVGCVISQSISDGLEVTRGTEIQIVVCSTKDLVTVENVTGQSFETAKATLEIQGFNVVKSEAYSNTVAKGLVISQLPESGSVLVPGATVTLTVSKGKEPEPEKPVQNTIPNNGNTTHTWSNWESSIPVGVNSSNYYIEQRTQYRYRTRETTQSTEAALDGWTLYNTTSSWSEWGNWSDWSTSPVSPSDSRNVETKKQYRYSDLQTTTSIDGALSGWRQTGSTQAWSDYGGWSGWQDSAVSASDSRQVETRTVSPFYYFYCANCGRGARAPYHSYACEICGQYAIYLESGTVEWFTNSWSDSTKWGSYPKYYQYIDGGIWWNWVDGSPKTQYRYRDRSLVTTYSYERWGEWSSWSDSSYSQSNMRQVENRTVYRYCDRHQNYLYYYERWGNWSEYSDSPVSANENTQVQTRALYRYMKK